MSSYGRPYEITVGYRYPVRHFALDAGAVRDYLSATQDNLTVFVRWAEGTTAPGSRRSTGAACAGNGSSPGHYSYSPGTGIQRNNTDR